MDYIPGDSPFVPLHARLGWQHRSGHFQLLGEHLGVEPPKALAPITYSELLAHSKLV